MEARLDGVQVRQAMRAAPLVLSPDEGVREALERVKTSDLDAWPVANDLGLWGMIRKSDLEKATADAVDGRKVGDLLSIKGRRQPDPEAVPHLHPDHNLSLALERMGGSSLNVLPVVSRANARELIGIVVLGDVLTAYGVIS
jgi:CBS domain-containing protein